MYADFKIIASYPTFGFFEGEGEGEGGGGDGGDGSGGAAGGEGGAGDVDKKFTQAEVNNIVAKEKATWRKATEEQIKQLEGLKKSKNLSDKEKTELQGRIDDLSKNLLTKEQLAQKEKASLEKQHKEEKDKLDIERREWQERYTRERIDRDIIAAAKSADAVDEDQFVDLLSPKARLEQVLDEDGNPTGEWHPKVKLKDVDKDGKPVTLDLTVPEAIKRLKESQKYGNLFNSGAKGGLGGSGTRGQRGSGKDPSDMTPVEYRKWRMEQGLKKQKSGA